MVKKSAEALSRLTKSFETTITSHSAPQYIADWTGADSARSGFTTSVSSLPTKRNQACRQNATHTTFSDLSEYPTAESSVAGSIKTFVTSVSMNGSMPSFHSTADF